MPITREIISIDDSDEDEVVCLGSTQQSSQAVSRASSAGPLPPSSQLEIGDYGFEFSDAEDEDELLGDPLARILAARPNPRPVAAPTPEPLFLSSPEACARYSCHLLYSYIVCSPPLSASSFTN